jgi:hypothetical protein
MTCRSPLRGAAFAALFAAVPTYAQTSQGEAPAPKPAPTTIPEKIAPGAKPTEPTKNLSKELNRSNGVIHPKDVDPQMNQGAPRTLDRNVVPPPANGKSNAPQAK